MTNGKFEGKRQKSGQMESLKAEVRINGGLKATDRSQDKWRFEGNRQKSGQMESLKAKDRSQDKWKV